jgi:hypothetical protein
MTTGQMQQHVTLCGKRLTGLRHVCAFFDSRDEQYDVLLPYLKEGIERGDQVVTIFDSSCHTEHVERLESAGVAVPDARQREQLKILASEETYLKDGVFVVERMHKMLEEVLVSAKSTPYPHVRTVGDMEWALQNCDGIEDLIVYEARVNEMAPHHDCTLLCAYDINRFSGRVVADVLATHSHVVLNGQVFENPHYVEPVTYLKTLALRRRSESLARH